uniref:Uncharacterized protein n=1 Tax=Setaria viridis TaxID=4556 RepID=A0A4U6U0B8_SETVI|nr:hypothetical protein SEVIR_7G255150v2 [Setaria viridis]
MEPQPSRSHPLHVICHQEFAGVFCIWNSDFFQDHGVVELRPMVELPDTKHKLAGRIRGRPTPPREMSMYPCRQELNACPLPLPAGRPTSREAMLTRSAEA